MSDGMLPHKVQLGDTELTITRFRGLKALLASALVGRVMREVPDLQDRVTTFTKKYRKENEVELTRPMAKLPRFAFFGFTEEDFAASPDGIIRLPEEPTTQQIMLAVAPDLIDLARKELVRLLALIVIPNSELEAADDADDIEGALDKQGKTLIRTAEFDELLELFVVAWEVMRDQILAKKDKLGKLTELPFLRMWLSTQEVEEETPTPPTSPPESPVSSDTLEEESTTGVDETSSMVSPGTN
jgi:hypothetical protein